MESIILLATISENDVIHVLGVNIILWWLHHEIEHRRTNYIPSFRYAYSCLFRRITNVESAPSTSGLTANNILGRVKRRHEYAVSYPWFCHLIYFGFLTDYVIFENNDSTNVDVSGMSNTTQHNLSYNNEHGLPVPQIRTQIHAYQCLGFFVKTWWLSGYGWG